MKHKSQKNFKVNRRDFLKSCLAGGSLALAPSYLPTAAALSLFKTELELPRKKLLSWQQLKAEKVYPFYYPSMDFGLNLLIKTDFSCENGLGSQKNIVAFNLLSYSLGKQINSSTVLLEHPTRAPKILDFSQGRASLIGSLGIGFPQIKLQYESTHIYAVGIH